jgi:hypothetical protein
VTHFFSWINSILLSRYTNFSSIHPLKDILVASKFWQLQKKSCCKHLCAGLYGHKFSTYLGEFQGTQLLDCMVRVFMSLEMTNSLPKGHFCISVSNEWEFTLLHTLYSIWGWPYYFGLLSSLIGVYWHLIILNPVTFFVGTGVWTQGLIFTRQALEPFTQSPFITIVIFRIGSCVCLQLVSEAILLPMPHEQLRLLALAITFSLFVQMGSP